MGADAFKGGDSFMTRAFMTQAMKDQWARMVAQKFRSWMLATRDAHGLYAKFGFGPLEQPERIMRKHDPDIYKKPIR